MSEQARRSTCARCGASEHGRNLIYSPHSRLHYCTDFAACDRRRAAEALRLAREQGIVADFSLRKGGRATIYKVEGGKLYTESARATIFKLVRLGLRIDRLDRERVK